MLIFGLSFVQFILLFFYSFLEFFDVLLGPINIIVLFEYELLAFHNLLLNLLNDQYVFLLLFFLLLLLLSLELVVALV